MANVTITRTDIFPNTTVIKIYPRTAFHSQTGGVPTAKAVGEGTMTAGTVTIEGLTPGVQYTAYAEVGGADAYLAVQAPEAASVSFTSSGLPGPGMQGLLAESFDPIIASGTFGLTTAGTLYKVRVPLKEQVKITNILMFVTTAGGTLTAAENFIGIFAEGTRKLIGKATAAETIAKWETVGPALITIPLEAAIGSVGPGYVDVGMYYKGTTKPTFACGVAVAAGLINAGAASPQLRFASADTGLTTALPATMSTTQTATPSPIWVGLT